MPKLKTKKAAKKRFKISKTGKISFKSVGKSHLQSKYPSRHRRRQKREDFLSKVHAKLIKKFIQ